MDKPYNYCLLLAGRGGGDGWIYKGHKRAGQLNPLNILFFSLNTYKYSNSTKYRDIDKGSFLSFNLSRLKIFPSASLRHVNPFYVKIKSWYIFFDQRSL